jgi:signal transduction histidine kinase
LSAAIEWQANEFAKRSGYRLQLGLELQELPPNRERDIAVFRMIQEALTNVARHAHAKTVNIQAVAHLNELRVDIRDDGIGLPAKKLTSPGSLGLIGMRERAEGMGGTVEIVGRARGGTHISIRIPIKGNGPDRHKLRPLAVSEGLATSHRRERREWRHHP